MFGGFFRQGKEIQQPTAAQAVVGAGESKLESTYFNMGCGFSKLQGYINVDASPQCDPDYLFDLQDTPWPWPDASAECVVFNHSLEHMGQDPRVFLAMFQELYRICRHDAKVYINVPHPRHDSFLNDPTHVRPVTPTMLTLFDRAQNDSWKERGCSNTLLAYYLDVDFRLEKITTKLEEPYATQYKAGEITDEEMDRIERERNNVIREYHMELRVVKP